MVARIFTQFFAKWLLSALAWTKLKYVTLDYRPRSQNVSQKDRKFVSYSNMDIYEIKAYHLKIVLAIIFVPNMSLYKKFHVILMGFIKIHGLLICDEDTEDALQTIKDCTCRTKDNTFQR